MTDRRTSPGGGGTDGRVLQTLQHYFELELSPEHPLLDEIETVELPGGSWLMQQGDPGDSLYFLVRGRLQAWARDEHGNDRGRFLNEIVPGDSVGELSLLTGAPRAVGIQAIRDSLLVQLGREAFERLAQAYPALVLRLAANVASLLQSSARSKPSTRNLKTVALLPLHDSPRIVDFCRELTRQLEQQGSTLSLAPGDLGSKGAPIATLDHDQPVPDTLRNWLQDQESEHRFLLFHCRPGGSEWSHFVLRQSDMVVLVADASQSPAVPDWEHHLLETSGATIARQLLVLLQPPAATAITGTAQWLAVREIDFHVHVRQDRPDDLARVCRIVSGNALGLVLAGGAARGFAHLGVHRAMTELGLPIDWVGGTSIGAIMGAGIASPMSVEEALELARKAFVDGRPFSDFTIPVMSLIRGQRMENLLRKHLDYRIEDLPIPFFCVSCNLDTGSTNLHESGSLPEALRASAALPGIIPPAVVNQRLTIDGAVVNNLPVDVMQQKPVSRIVAVDLSTSSPVEVNYPSVPSPWAVLRGRYIPFARRHKVPGLSAIMLKATMLGTQERVREQGKKADILLTPPVRNYGLTEVRAFEKIVQAGYEHARAELSGWLEARERDERDL